MTRFYNYLNEMSLQKAAVFAAKKHSNQFRKGSGEPYIVHPRGVFKILRNLKINDIQILVAAYLHDTLEDTDATYNEIKKEFSQEVADIVKDLTNNPKEIDKIGKPEHLLNKMLKISNGALVIKLADRLQNLSDMSSVNKSFANKMWIQTTYIIKNLRKKRNLTQTQKKLVRKILDILKSYGSNNEIL
jgi:(p)ppGpp synthase/HD superfamily hydrolase